MSQLHKEYEMSLSAEIYIYIYITIRHQRVIRTILVGKLPTYNTLLILAQQARSAERIKKLDLVSIRDNNRGPYDRKGLPLGN